MRYAIKINQSERCPDVPCMAINFIRALKSEGHEVVRVFFYHDGVIEGSGSMALSWVDLAKEGGLDLVLCSHALNQRGFSLAVEAPFRVGGLGLWVDACLKADRVITFGIPSHAI